MPNMLQKGSMVFFSVPTENSVPLDYCTVMKNLEIRFFYPHLTSMKDSFDTLI